MKKSLIIIAITAFFTFTGGIAYSAITVESVKGEAAVKEGNQWTPLQPGQTLKDGSKISTGVNSSAVIKIDAATVIIKPMTMMKIFKSSAKNSAGTHLGLKFGSLNAKVQKIGKLKTSFKISTPVATSSVRGTEQNVSFGPASGMIVEVISGEIQGETNNGQSNNITGNQTFQINPNDPKPDSLLSNLSNSSLQPLFDPNNIDENHSFVFDGIYGSGTDTGDATDNPILPPATTKVNVQTNWPE